MAKKQNKTRIEQINSLWDVFCSMCDDLVLPVTGYSLWDICEPIAVIRGVLVLQFYYKEHMDKLLEDPTYLIDRAMKYFDVIGVEFIFIPEEMTGEIVPFIFTLPEIAIQELDFGNN